MYDDTGVQQLGPAARLSLRFDPAVTVPDADAIGGLRFDMPINRCAVGDGWIVARLGPDEFLLLGPDEAPDTMIDKLEAALQGRFFSLVDIGSRNEGFRVAGTRAADILNAGCPLDLGNEAFPPWTATRTLFGKAEIVLIRPGTRPAWRVECWRSFAPYVHGLLLDVAGPDAAADKR